MPAARTTRAQGGPPSRSERTALGDTCALTSATLPSDAPRAAKSPALPNPKHLQRLPAYIGWAQVERIRHAVHCLPQVVKPADYVPEHSPGFESRLDRLGLVQLQKVAPSGRPSRGIEPGLMDSALAHLDAVGTGPDARPLMLERRAALEGLGVTRQGGDFSRQVRHTLHVPVPEGTPWPITVSFRVPVDAASV